MPDNTDIATLKQRARECLQANDLPQAHSLLTEATALSDADAEIWLLLGVTDGMKGDPAAAEHSLQRAIELRPDYPQALYNLGRAQRDQGKIQAAAETLQQAAQRLPGDPAVLIALADALAQINNMPEAHGICEQVLRLAPGHPEALVCQGNLLHLQGCLDDAIASYDQALSSPAAPLAALINKGLILQAQTRLDEALACLQAALKVNDNLSAVHGAIGTIHIHLGERKLAEISLARAFSLNPQNTAIGMELAAVLRCEDKLEAAAEVYQKILEIDPDNVSAQFYLAATTAGEGQPERVPGAVVRKVYNHAGGGANFDASLTRQMQYKGPELVDHAVRQALDPDTSDLHILELGCGTGLCGSLLSNLAERMVGVDLSAEMIETARRKDIYNELLVEDLHDVLDRSVSKFDLVFGMDVFCYFGDLSEVISKCVAALRPGGLLGFSVEKADPGKPWQFHRYGHFLHSIEHIRSVAENLGLTEQSVTEATLRIEMREPRIGYVCMFRKP